MSAALVPLKRALCSCMPALASEVGEQLHGNAEMLHVVWSRC